jgi:nucleotide-binding universal stress UspA family protein
MENREIVVGTDGSGWSATAVRWAALEARRRKVPLHVVHAYDWHHQPARYGGAGETRAVAESEAESVVNIGVIQAKEAATGLTVRHDTAIGAPATVLLEAAEDAALLVVGNRGRGGFGSLMLGSVGQRVASHARCPVVVVRGARQSFDGPIVVGADGSPSSNDAVGLAFQLAAERDRPVVAVRAYEPPSPPWGGKVQPVVYDSKDRDVAEHEALTASLAPWRAKFPDVTVEELVAHGPASRVLVGVSHTAQLVVVGSRGHGSFAGTMVGSVGLQLLHHAECPVLINRVPTDA